MVYPSTPHDWIRLCAKLQEFKPPLRPKRCVCRSDPGPDLTRYQFVDGSRCSGCMHFEQRCDVIRLTIHSDHTCRRERGWGWGWGGTTARANGGDLCMHQEHAGLRARAQHSTASASLYASTCAVELQTVILPSPCLFLCSGDAEL